MSIGAFVDKQHQPTIDAMIASVRLKRRLWEGLTQFIDENYRVKRDFAFYGKNYGWALRFRSGGRALASFYPGAGSFTVQIIIGPAQLEEACSCASALRCETFSETLGRSPKDDGSLSP